MQRYQVPKGYPVGTPPAVRSTYYMEDYLVPRWVSRSGNTDSGPTAGAEQGPGPVQIRIGPGNGWRPLQ
ncbi:hypothetical protein VTG60DRAFT_2356 [Thermothelomyces hinnuleus]